MHVPSLFSRKKFVMVAKAVFYLYEALTPSFNTVLSQCQTLKRTELALYNRHITRLPEILLMQHLKILDLRFNDLQTLPISGLDNLVSLQEFYLDNNQLVSLPHGIGNLQKLVVLSVKKNKLTTLPPSLPLLFNLQQLFISDNNIPEVPLILGSLKGLKKLDASNNPFLKKIPSDVTDLMSYLREQEKNAEKRTARIKLVVCLRTICYFISCGSCC
jgi:Leucine-rich repeat (LRR) protein